MTDQNEDDELVTVVMPRGEYKLMRKLIKDYAATTRFLKIVKTFTFVFCGVLAAWLSFGEKLLSSIKFGVK